MQYIKMLSELNRDDLPIAGGKGANLGAMINAGLPVPAGFCVTTAAYRRFVEHNQLQDRILQMAAQAQPDRMDQLETVSDHIRQLFETGQMPEDITAEIRTAYLQASQAEGEDAFAAAVRSSATAEDLPDFSFAGQQDTYLNITGEQALIQAVVRCWGSLWTARAIGYRARNGIAQDEVSLAVVVQQMVLSEASGVLFTANPLTGKRSETVVDATLGLGEALVAGMVEPDQYLIDTRAGKILKKTLGAKALSIRAVEGGGTNTVHEDAALQQALPDEQILALAELGQRAARYFGSPQDMEWAWSGGRLYVLQSRPITSLYPLPEGLPEEPLKILFSVAGWQGMLDPISPLGRDTLMNLIIGIFNHVGAGLNPYDQQILLSAGERLFPNLTGMFRSSLGRKILGVVLPAVDPASLDIVQALMEDPRLSVEPKGIRLSTYWRLLRIFLPVAGHVTLNFQNPSREREILNRKIAAILQQAEEDMQQADDLIPMVDLVEEKLRSLPSASSGDIFGKRKMIFTRAIQGSTNPFLQLTRWQRAVGFDNPPFAMHPLGFDRVEPGALDRQRAYKNADALACLCHLPIVGTDPVVDRTTGMPASVIPNQDPYPLALLLQLVTAPSQKLGGNRTHWTAIHKAQPDGFFPLPSRLRTMAQQNAIASQRFAIGVLGLGCLFHQAQRLPIRRPTVQMRLGKAAPPGFVLKANDPVGMAAGQRDQSIPELFFRWYSGSGLVIHCLARFQRTPRRTNVARIVSPLTRRSVKPRSKETSATNSSVHKLVALPYCRGLLWSNSFSRSACSDGMASPVLCGRRDCCSSAFRPSALKALITSRTVWSLHPKFLAIRMACWPRALASRIWQRRKTKASDERKPASNCLRSSSVKVLTYNGDVLMPPLYHISSYLL